MNNKPKVFQNKIDKKINTNNNIYYSNNDKDKTADKKPIKNKEIIPNSTKIRKKINEIFTSRNYIYKANVEIKTKDNTYVTKIIGRNKSHLITMDNKTILIDDIIDIEKK